MNEEPPIDPLPQMLAQVDQAIAETGVLARLAMGYFAAFVECGFSERQALYLTAVRLQDGPGEPPS